MSKPELFYFLEGVDDSILSINDVIKDLQLEFIKFSYKEFEKKFAKFFLHEESDTKKVTVTLSIEDKSIYEKVSVKFQDAILNSNLITADTLNKMGYIILLEDHAFQIVSDIEVPDESEFGEIDPEEIDNQRIGPIHLLDFIDKLRLVGKGHIRFVSSFICSEDGKWDIAGISNLPVFFRWKNRYQINISDTAALRKKLLNDLIIPPLIQLAFDSLNEVYEIQNDKVKFIVLMIALESIYNKTGDIPINHIISRHVALTLTSEKAEFEIISKSVKELYDLRSIIVHGSTDKNRLKKLESLSEKLDSLNEIVRRVLEKLIWLYDFEISEPTKDGLFNYLNAKGFTG